jgi:cephalosporin hydroxylase
MDIQSLSMNMSQARVQEQAGVKVQAMGLDVMKQQMAAMDKLISSVQPILDPNMGQRVNILV